VATSTSFAEPPGAPFAYQRLELVSTYFVNVERAYIEVNRYLWGTLVRVVACSR
jgi:hypothetical protein